MKTLGHLMLLACLGTGACLHRAVVAPEEPRMQPTESWLIHQGTPTSPMDVVTNDLPEGEGLLRSPSLPLDPADPDLALLEQRLQATVLAESGVGIAAPQVGILRRAIVVQRQDQEGSPFVFYLNPRILAYGAETEIGWEGCLSVPAGYGEVERALAITLAWQDPIGVEETEEVTGWTARIFQHEIDHLDGVLFVDRTVTPVLVDKEVFRARRAAERAAREAAELDATNPTTPEEPGDTD